MKRKFGFFKKFIAKFGFIKKLIDKLRKKPEPLLLPEPEIIEEKPEIKAGIVFGSGGTRGFAHLGAIKAFEDEGIKFDYVAGTSAGSIAGALYAAGLNSGEIAQFISKISIKDVKGSKFVFMPTTTTSLQKTIRQFLVGKEDFSQLDKKFVCCAVDLVSGKEVVFSEGDVPFAVAASCCVPPFFKPVIMGDMHLIDGAYANPIPANHVRELGANVVISVEVNTTRGVGTSSLSMWDVYNAATRIAMRATADDGIAKSDLLICPKLAEYKSFDVKGVNQMIKIGYEETYRHMKEIKTLLNLDNPESANPLGAPTIEFLNIKV